MRKELLGKILMVLGVLLGIAVAISIGYSYEWTGFGASTISTNPNQGLQPPKKLWDWLELLVIPVVLAVGGLWFSWAERRSEQSIAQQRIEEDRRIADQRIEEDRRIAEQRIEEDRRIADQRIERERYIENERAQDATLQAYFEQMSMFLIDKELRQFDRGTEVRALANAWTLTFLGRLDGERKGILLRFLYESKLIQKGTPIISLEAANLNKIDLSGANLPDANLTGSHLFDAKLFGANLTNAALARVMLVQANMYGTKLKGADLSGAYLYKSNLSEANLLSANLTNVHMETASYNKATIWPNDFDPLKAGAILITEKTLN